MGNLCIDMYCISVGGAILSDDDVYRGVVSNNCQTQEYVHSRHHGCPLILPDWCLLPTTPVSRSHSSSNT